ncbi:MAG: VTT domain-containing protein [Acidobacteriota bacterium]|nr:VTT domain-containing protein [Acidobacteriota bacterium]
MFHGLTHDLTGALLAFGPWGLLALAFIDSAGIPVPAGMDALLIFLSVKSPHQAYWFAAIAVAGSLAGNLSLFLTARRGGRKFLEKSAEPGKAQRFRDWFLRYGLVTVFVPAFIPIPMPLKLFVISAGVLHTALKPFLAVTLLARVLRYFGEAWLGVTLKQQSGVFFKNHAWHFAIAAVILFAALYWIVRLSDRWRKEVYK